MMSALAVVLAVAVAALAWQSWRLNNASHTIETQSRELNGKTQELAKKKQSADRSVHSDRNQQQGADPALCGGRGYAFFIASAPEQDRGA